MGDLPLPPNILVALISVVSGLLILIGGLVVGRAGRSRFVARIAELQKEIEVGQERIRSAKADAIDAHEKLDNEREIWEQRKSALEQAATQEDASGGVATMRALGSELEETKNDLDEAEKKIAELTKERDEAISRAEAAAKQPEPKKGGGDASAEKAKAELKERDRKISELTKSLDEAKKELAEAKKELAEAKKDAESAQQRLSISERVMDGVRARSAMLAEELNQAKADLEKLKGS